MYRHCGRNDDMSKVSGLWVSPFDVESALMTHPSVLEAAVVAKKDNDGLLRPKAFITLKDERWHAEPLREMLKEHVKQQIDVEIPTLDRRGGSVAEDGDRQASSASSCARTSRF